MTFLTRPEPAPSRVTRVRVLREHRRLTAAQVAEAVRGQGVNLSRSALSQVELGNRGVSVEELVALRKVFGVGYADLIDRTVTDDVGLTDSVDVVLVERAAERAAEIVFKRLQEGDRG